MSEAGSDADDLNFELLSHISPIGWDNVLLYGEYQLNRSLVRSERLSVSIRTILGATLGGPSRKVSRDLDEGDIIWLVPQISDEYQLEALHWEVLSLEDSSDKLLAAKTVKRGEFEEALRAKLQPLQGRTA